MIDIDNDPQSTLEEEFAYWISKGKTKSDAYRAIIDCSGLDTEHIAMRAWRYSNKPQVVSLLANEEDNSYIKYMSMRRDVLSTMYDIALNGSSERSQIDSASTLLQHTAKLAKNSIEVNIQSNEMNVMLEDLRSVLLSPPVDSLGGIKTPNQIAYQELKSFQSVEVEPIYNVRPKKEGLYIGDKLLTQEALDEQVSGINPLGNRKGDSHSRIQDYSTGRFVDYTVAQDWLNEHPKDVSLKTEERSDEGLDALHKIDVPEDDTTSLLE